MFLVVSGDRTPKQKVKLKVTEEKLLNLMLKYNGGRPRSEVLLFITILFVSVLPATYSFLIFLLPFGRQNLKVLFSCKIC